MERKYKILIADDDNKVLSEYGEYFLNQGFIVELAHDGVELLWEIASW